MRKSTMESASWQRLLYGSEITPNQAKMSLKSEFSDGLGGAIFYKALRTILFIFLICLVSSCSKDDELPPVTIEGMYEESQTLQYQTPDSIENFAAKFYGYLEVHPDACNHPYYGAIDNKIYELSSQGVMVNTDWDGEIFKEFTNKTDDSKELRKGGRYTDD